MSYVRPLVPKSTRPRTVAVRAPSAFARSPMVKSHFRKVEGVVSRRYDDLYGNPTIGVGHLITKETTRYMQEAGISENRATKLIGGQAEMTDAEIDKLLMYDITRKNDETRGKFTERGYRYQGLPEDVRLSLVNMRYRGDLDSRTIEALASGKKSEIDRLRKRFSAKKQMQASGIRKRVMGHMNTFKSRHSEIRQWSRNAKLKRNSRRSVNPYAVGAGLALILAGGWKALQSRRSRKRSPTSHRIPNNAFANVSSHRIPNNALDGARNNVPLWRRRSPSKSPNAKRARTDTDRKMTTLLLSDTVINSGDKRRPGAPARMRAPKAPVWR